ncbi:MAG: thioredoxin family protein [Candidatus Hydrothermarchaeota archaeon]
MPVKIEIFKSSDCPYCDPTIEFVKSVVKELRNETEIEIIDVSEQPSKVSKYGIYAVPTVAINGTVEFVGRPDKKSLIEAINSKI